MSRILVLAKSGFGKTFSIGKIPELGHIGLDPKDTYIISVTSKPLTFLGSNNDYIVASKGDPSSGNRYITNNPEEISDLLMDLRESPYKNIILDDFNYLMQDYYMDNALKQGWDGQSVPLYRNIQENNRVKTVKRFAYINYFCIFANQIYDYLYKDATMFLKRKEQILNTVSNSVDKRTERRNAQEMNP